MTVDAMRDNTTRSSSASPVGGFHHAALLLPDDTGRVAVVHPFVEAGLTAGEPVLVAMPGHRLASVREAFGGVAGLSLVDLSELGRNPSRIIPAVLHPFLARYMGRPVRVVTEPVWAGRSPLAYPRCVQHEALVNLAFAACTAMMLCAYDTVGLPAEAVQDAARTHPFLAEGDGYRPSGTYDDPVTVVDAYNRSLPAPVGPVTELRFDVDGLADVRALAVEVGERAGLDQDQLDDLRIAVTELATNAITHGRPPAVLRVWADRLAVRCEVTGSGSLTDRLAGRIPPAPGSVRGRGLVLVNQLCDLVDIHTDEHSTTVRIHLGRPAPHPAPDGADALVALSPSG